MRCAHCNRRLKRADAWIDASGNGVVGAHYGARPIGPVCALRLGFASNGRHPAMVLRGLTAARRLAHRTPRPVEHDPRQMDMLEVIA